MNHDTQAIRVILVSSVPIIGIAGIGTYIPETFMTPEEIADSTGIPQEVIELKFGVKKTRSRSR